MIPHFIRWLKEYEGKKLGMRRNCDLIIVLPFNKFMATFKIQYEMNDRRTLMIETEDNHNIEFFRDAVTELAH